MANNGLLQFTSQPGSQQAMDWSFDDPSTYWQQNLDPEYARQLLEMINAGARDPSMSLHGGSMFVDGYHSPGAPTLIQSESGPDGGEWVTGDQELRRLLNDGSKYYDRWSPTGDYLGRDMTESSFVTAREGFKFPALIAGLMYGGAALNNAYGAGAGAASGAEAGGALSGWDAAMADAAASGSITPEVMATAGGTAGATGGTQAGTQAAQQTAQNTATQSVIDRALGKAADNAVPLLATAAGAVAGAADSQDKTQSSSVQPWEPAQPYLKGLLADGAQLYDQYKRQPFNAAQQAGYTNLGGLLDLIGQNAQGLLAGPQANASGANQFRRGQPQQGLLGSDFRYWGSPSGYGNFGVK